MNGWMNQTVALTVGLTQKCVYTMQPVVQPIGQQVASYIYEALRASTQTYNLTLNPDSHDPRRRTWSETAGLTTGDVSN